MDDVLNARSHLHDVLQSLPSLAPDDINGALLSDWVVVMNWVDPEDGESYLVMTGAVNQLSHQRDGLLFQALHKMGD